MRPTGSIGGGLYFLGWIVTVIAAFILMTVAKLHLTSPWDALVGSSCFLVLLLLYGRLGTWLQVEERGWFVINDYFRPADPVTKAAQRRLVLRQTFRLASLVTLVSLVAWPIFALALSTDPVTKESIGAAVRYGVRLSILSAGITAFFGSLLYASRVRVPDRKNDA